MVYYYSVMDSLGVHIRRNGIKRWETGFSWLEFLLFSGRLGAFDSNASSGAQAPKRGSALHGFLFRVIGRPHPASGFLSKGEQGHFTRVLERTLGAGEDAEFAKTREENMV